MIYFKKITYDNVDAMTLLEVNEAQKGFVATNTASLIDAYVAISNGYMALPFGIYDDEVPIGFIMFGYGSLEDDDEPENTVAKDLYRKFGFVENGEICGNEVVAVLKL